MEINEIGEPITNTGGGSQGAGNDKGVWCLTPQA